MQIRAMATGGVFGIVALTACSPTPPMIEAPPPGVTATVPGDRPAGNRTIAEGMEPVASGPSPTIVKRVPPVYPDIAREARVDGTVIVQARISPGGQIVEMRVSKSIPMLDAAAQECVRQWKFEPARLEGQPIEAWVDCPVVFVLP